MANNKGTARNGYKILAIVLALVFFAAFLVAGFGSSWFKNGDITTWYNNWGKGEEQGETGGDNLGTSGALLPSVVEGKGMKLVSAPIPEADFGAYGIAEQSDSAYTVTATVLPEFAADKTVTVSAKFANASSAWASGKTLSSYVTVANQSSGSATVIVTIKQAFGEPVTVTIVSNADPEVSASFPVHYVKRITNISSSVTYGGVATKIALGKDVNYTVTPTFGVGTVQGTTTVSAKINFSATNFWTNLKGNQYFRVHQPCINQKL